MRKFNLTASARKRTVPHTVSLLFVFLLGAIVSFIFSMLNMQSGNNVMAVLELAGTGIIILASLHMLKTKKTKLATAVILFVAIIILAATMINGGFNQMGMYWFAFFPIVAYYSLGLRTGTGWIITFTLTVLLTIILTAQGVIETAYSINEILVMLLSTIVVSMISYAYEHQRQRDTMKLENTLEELLEAQQRSEVLAMAKDEFLCNMSHEIRTPLHGVIGMTNILLDTQLQPRQFEYASIINQSSELLLQLINNILDFAKIESKGFSQELSPFNLKKTLEILFQVLAASSYQKGVELILDYGDDVPEEVLGDSQHLTQVLMNLMGNAIKFTSEGYVLLKTRLAEDNMQQARISFSITDTGIGIPEEDQITVFSKFNQVEQSPNRRFEGSGLGLAISRRVVLALGGDIELVSQIDKGSTFSFELSFGKPEIQPVPANSTLFAEQRCLVVVQEQLLQDVLKQFFKRRGGSAIIVENEKQAIRKLEESNDYDFIIIEGILPKAADLHKLTARIQSKAGGKTIQTYLLVSPTDLPQCDISSINGIIPKPLLDSVLEKTLTADTTQPHLSQDSDQIFYSLKVLIAEDNKINQLVADRFLRRMGCTATIVENGQKAIDAVKQHDFDIILMDCQMPVIDGYEATRQIRLMESQTPDTPAIPIIAITAHAQENDRIKCIDAGMNDYLSKPFRPETFEETIRKHAPLQTNL